MSNVNKSSHAVPPRGRLAAHLALVAVVAMLVSSAVPASAATATFTGLGYGVKNTVQGRIGTDPAKTFGFVGVFHIKIDGSAQTDAYCVDIKNSISVGDSEPQVAPDYPCEVVYILNNVYPNTNTIGTTLSDLNREAAAVQAAIWKFTDGFAITSPSDIVSRAGQIVNAAKSQCGAVPPTPQSISLTPATAINYLPADKIHIVTATVTGSNGKPLAGQVVDVVVTGASGPQTFHGGTSASGEMTVAYQNASVVTGTDKIAATAAFMIPVGVKFKKLGKQGIVLAGQPRPGKVSDCASKNWVAARCGDGIVNQSGELCDDGNSKNGDGCDDNCSPTRCGNGIVTAGEECDDGNAANGDGCDANCTPTECGNGIVSAGEECDDGNAVNGDTCDSNCTRPRCGNGITTGTEECDDGNHVNGDTCDDNCSEPRCGNGIVAGTEECDDGNAVNGDACDNNCTKPACGNGIVANGEECDDGNHVDGDGCDSNCTITGCGNGIATAGEECDDGNAVDGDACETDCTLPRCGNAIVDRDEECDDGNTADGDGCSKDCMKQEICADLVDNDGDGLIDCDDPDCPECLHITKDPASVTFKDAGPDVYKVHGRIDPVTPIAPTTEEVGILLTNADGIIYKALLYPGDITGRRDARFLFVDRAARKGNGIRGGIGKLTIRRLAHRYWFTVETYGDLRGATLPVMTVQLMIGDDVFSYKSEWKRTRTGWKVDFDFPIVR